MQLILFVTAALLAGVSLRLLLRSGLTSRFADQPNHRSLHKVPVPRIGGIALIGTSIVLSVVCWAWMSRAQPAMIDLPIAMLLLCLLILAGVGIGDDQYGLGPVSRALIQLLCAVGLWFAWFVQGGFEPAWTGSAAMALLLVVGALVWSANLFNFMDGSDGIAGAMTVAGFGAMAWAAPWPGLTGTMAVVTAGAAAGFLVFNWHPARVFLGDAGSVPLGFLAAALAINGAMAGFWPFWFPLACFMPFVFDASATLLRRIAQGHKPWQAHRDHAYQRLILAGFGHDRIAIGYFLLAVLSSTLAAMIRYQNGYVFFAAWTVIIGVHAGAYQWALRYATKGRSEQQ